MADSQETARLNRIESCVERLAVPKHLLRRRPGRLCRKGVVAEELVVGRNYVFNRGAVLRLPESERIDQDGLIRDRAGNPLQFGELAGRSREPFENGRGFEAFAGQASQTV